MILRKQNSTRLSLLLPLFVAGILVGCGSDNDHTVIPTPEPAPAPAPEPTEYRYEVTVTNLTHSQPLSPITAILHGDEKMWSIGTTASMALEKLAESGDNSDFIADAMVLTSAVSDGVVMPGASSTITITTTDEIATHFTLATMLVNTNDAFSGLTGLELASLSLNVSMSWNLNVYDAGTEANSELANTIPGPAAGGTGYDMARDDTDVVAMHSGVVTKDDGLTTSVLTEAHRFDNPALKLTVTRIK